MHKLNQVSNLCCGHTLINLQDKSKVSAAQTFPYPTLTQIKWEEFDIYDENLWN